MEKFLEKNNSVVSVNKEGSINVGLSVKQKLMSNDDLDKTFSLYDEYNAERDSCDRFRIICEINPICTNILFNNKTEIVTKEGSDECEVILDNGETKNLKQKFPTIQNTTDVDYMQAIRDTEYSHPSNGEYTYHCGLDILNNHMIRSVDFTHVNEIGDESDTESPKVYNTINDFLRDGRGYIVKERTNYNQGIKTLMPIHIYNRDSLLSFKNTYKQKLTEKDGWWGFTNPGNMNIPNNSGSTVLINRMMAKNKPCEFIDMYPDRSLYSFIPKYNKYRNRIEKNWDYCLTYPYDSDYDIINTICGGENQALKAFCKITHNGGGTQMLQCRSMFKHNLKKGDYVYFYRYNSDGSFVKNSTKVIVYSVGDANGEDTRNIFSVKYSDVAKFYNQDDGVIFFKHLVNNTESTYYMRIFKKIQPMNSDGERVDRDFRSDINKIAFAQNIYGDDMAQIIFTDDVNVEGLFDNNGRPVSKIYLTVVKRNAGHDLWYSKSPVFNTSDIEYSHCFGKVTSGFDLGTDELSPKDYNVRYLHNVDLSGKGTDSRGGNTIASWGETLVNYPNPEVLEDDITIDGGERDGIIPGIKELKEDEFYGDVVEFNSYDYTETSIDNVYHRFNTAQREYGDGSKNPYTDIKYDEISLDDYDLSNNKIAGFKTVTRYLNDKEKNTIDDAILGPEFNGNISPEGYFYNPHMEIKIREESYTESVASVKTINYSKCTRCAMSPIESAFTDVEIVFPTNYGFVKNDSIALFNKESEETVWGTIFSVSGNTMRIRFSKGSIRKSSDPSYVDYIKYMDPYDGTSVNSERIFVAYWSDISIPYYAKYCQARRAYVWKSIVYPSEMSRDMDLYDMPFSNGRLYANKVLNFYLRRQDPDGKSGLSVPINNTMTNPVNGFAVKGYEHLDLSSIKTFVNNTINLCQ